MKKNCLTLKRNLCKGGSECFRVALAPFRGRWRLTYKARCSDGWATIISVVKPEDDRRILVKIALDLLEGLFANGFEVVKGESDFDADFVRIAIGQPWAIIRENNQGRARVRRVGTAARKTERAPCCGG